MLNQISDPTKPARMIPKKINAVCFVMAEGRLTNSLSL
jgi:hypothetical protein